MNTIKFGAWGFGRMGSRHGQYFALESDKLKLVAACDTDAARLAGARAESKCAVYTDFNRYDQEIPWVEETLRVEPVGDMWEYIDRKLIRHLHETIRNGAPFPIQNHDAFETVRIMQTVKAQNPQFAWKQDDKDQDRPDRHRP